MKKPQHKFKAQRTETDGIKFDSKKEAEFYRELKLRQQAGDIVFFLRQVPMDLPGNVKYRVDFVIFEASGDVRFVDVKGYRTKGYVKTKKQVEALYPVEIEEV